MSISIKKKTCSSARPIIKASQPDKEQGRLTNPTVDLGVTYRVIDSLKPYDRNTRSHSDKQIGLIAQSITSFGFNNPILIDEHNHILAGHGRYEAAKQLGMSEVPTFRLDHLDASQRRAYRIADNRIAELSGWDDEMLQIEIGALADLEFDGDLDFDIRTIGFETAEIDLILDSSSPPVQPDPLDSVPDATVGPAVTVPGDLWVLGDHRILCADALKPESYHVLMAGEKVRLVFTDPPYNVPISGHVSGLGKIKHREFAMASGEMSDGEFTRFLTRFLELSAASCCDGAILYTCMDWAHVQNLLESGTICGLDLKNICIWNKNNGGMGSFYRSEHEMVCVFKTGTAPHINTIELGENGRYRTNVWDYAGANTFRKGRMDDLADHPTVKPVALVVDAIKDASKRGDLILDPFIGSGTTLLAAEKSSRVARRIEIDPAYVDTALRRFEQAFAIEAVHAESGLSYSEMVKLRPEQATDHGEVRTTPPPVRIRTRPQAQIQNGGK